jgi:5'(3')-deoxyribonucleotidase
MQQTKRRIGVDIDDTLLDFVGSYIEYSNKMNKTNLKREDFILYSFSNKTIFDFYDSDFFRKMLPLPESVETINCLKKNYDLYIVTSRPNYLYINTMNQLWEHFRSIFSEVFFSSNHYTGEKNSGKTKADICLENGISILIDDSLEYALQGAKKGLEVFLLDYPWNKKEDHKKIFRAENWKEIGRKLLK